MTSVLIADDQRLLRASFTLLIDCEDDLTVVADAENGQAAVDLTLRHRPDVVLMDVRMPGMDGIEATRRICRAAPGTRILMLTTFDLDEYVWASLRAGASGFLLKDTPPEQLVHAIRVIASGEGLLAPSVTRRLISEFTRQPSAPGVDASALADVTTREREILLLIAKGLSNTEIAEFLTVSLATVKTHVSRLLMKLSARDRTQLVIVAYESGLMNRA
ncbi:LuxR family two component transcriptional regulator [Stackebrandtia endophytica]|uniref:LuxR family two component transcriptional regulator n=1 Tax=Stackebrandtia endophytica TaxID=1496996 RepID=A0A543B1X4_9ACTN|nr:response regulator transcription factor [Stackebrandtia endophytica]TQL78833.1 LuxR family two component transcriptional regulator [Stackebrandtia endophytica]